MDQNIPQLEEKLSTLYGFKNIEWLDAFGGYSSLNLHMRANNAHWLVKKYGKLALKRLLELNELMRILQFEEFPAVAPLINCLERAEFQCDDETFAVFPVIAGNKLQGDQLTLPALSSTAQLIARFHRLGSGRSLNLGAGRELLTPSEFNARGKAIIDSKALSALPSPDADAVLQSLSVKAAFLNGVTSAFFDFEVLKKSTDLVHGDFHNENILYSENKTPICLLDFEESFVGHRVIDLIQFVQLALCNSDYTSKSLEKSRYFLLAYAEQSDLKSAEIHAGLRHNFAIMATSLFFEEKLLDGGNSIFVEFLQRDFRKIEFYRKNADLLHDALAL